MARLLLIVALISAALAQTCSSGPLLQNYTVVTVPSDGSSVSISGSFSYANGNPYPSNPCGWILRTTNWPLYGQMIATVQSVFFSPIPQANSGWQVSLMTLAEGIDPPLVASTPVIFGRGGSYNRVPLTNGLNLQDYTTTGIKNVSDPFFNTPNVLRKDMAVAVTFQPQNPVNDNWNQLPIQTVKFSMSFAVSVDKCPSDLDFWLPRPLGPSPNYHTLTAACVNYNNNSCCNPGTGQVGGIPSGMFATSSSQRAYTHAVAPDDTYGGGNQNMATPVAALFDHQWARNDTECYHYYQVTACASRCSPRAVTGDPATSFITTNWDGGLINLGARRTLKLCSNFCQRVWGACQNERIRAVIGATSNNQQGVQIGNLYQGPNDFCYDFFNYLYPPAAISTQKDGISNQNIGLIQPATLHGTETAVIVEIDNGSPCFDPSAEPGSASSLAVSLLVLLAALALSF